MRTFIRLQALGVLVATALGVWWLGSGPATAAVAIRSDIEVQGATPEQLALARWTSRRFEIAGLVLPRVEIEFHVDPAGCSGHLGFARLGQVDICTVLVNAMSRRALLHEMSHIWLDQNLDAEVREQFLELRDLPSWNASSEPWALRGYEQGAEIMAWALGERILTPQIPDTDPGPIGAAYEVLTGRAFRPRWSMDLHKGGRWPAEASTRANPEAHSTEVEWDTCNIAGARPGSAGPKGQNCLVARAVVPSTRV
jgi:hypothetical protein